MNDTVPPLMTSESIIPRSVYEKYKPLHTIYSFNPKPVIRRFIINKHRSTIRPSLRSFQGSVCGKLIVHE